jgi:hypothetical protein
MYLNILADELELPEGPLRVVLALEVGEGDLVDAALEPVAGNPGAGGPVHQGLAHLPHLEHRGGLDVIPATRNKKLSKLRVIKPPLRCKCQAATN